MSQGGEKRPLARAANRTLQYGRIPYWLVDGGLWATLKPADHAVYGVIAAHAGRDWAAHPSLDRIASLAGLTRGTVCVALQRLEAGGVIEVERGGGRGNPNVYKLLTNSLRRQTVSEGERVCAHGDKQSAPNVETVCAERENSLSRPDGNRRGTERTEQQQNGATATAEVFGESEEMKKCRLELVRLGIADPKLSALLKHSAMSLWAIEKAKSNLNGKQSVGALIRGVEAILTVAPELHRKEICETEMKKIRERQLGYEQYPDRRTMVDEMRSVPGTVGAELRSKASKHLHKDCPDNWHRDEEWVRAIYDIFRIWLAKQGQVHRGTV